MFNKCPKGIFTKISVSGGYFDVCPSMGHGCMIIYWNSPIIMLCYQVLFSLYVYNAHLIVYTCKYM